MSEGAAAVDVPVADAPAGAPTVVIAAGGTAGHVFPAIAVALELQRCGVRPVFVGTRDRLESWLVPEAGFELHHIDALPLPRRLSLGLLRLPLALRAAVRQCEGVIERVGPRGAVAFGGYVSFPLTWASARLDIPLLVHEQNAVPGLANRFAARWADRVCVSFPGSVDRFGQRVATVVSGNPVREEILRLDADAARPDALAHFGLEPARRTVLVFGGSQGARSINEAIIDSHHRWTRPDQLQVLHAAGQGLYAEAAAGWERSRTGRAGPLVRCVDFIDDMAAAYAAADLAVCRAGATTIAELTAVGRPAVLVPYPHATRDHQLHNARALERAGAGRVLLDSEIGGQQLVAAAEPLLADEQALLRASRAARAFGRRDAARTVASVVLELIEGRSPR